VRSLICIFSIMVATAAFPTPGLAAGARTVAPSGKPGVVLDFSSYSGGPVDHWLQAQGFQFEEAAKDPKRLRLSIENGALVLEARGRIRGFLLNDAIDVPTVNRVRIEWGVNQYPKDAAYSRRINNEALMVYFFFGSEKISSGHILIPASPYFIGLFLCQDDLVNHPYKGRYFHAGGRFVCLGKPKPGEMTTSEFDLNSAFKSYFGKHTTPGITGIGLGVDTSVSGNDGKTSAFLKSVELIGGAGN